MATLTEKFIDYNGPINLNDPTAEETEQHQELADKIWFGGKVEKARTLLAKTANVSSINQIKRWLSEAGIGAVLTQGFPPIPLRDANQSDIRNEYQKQVRELQDYLNTHQ